MVEVFSGRAVLTRCVRNAGFAACSMDRGLVGPCLCKGTAREPHHVFQSARFADTIRICVICLHHEYRRSPVRAWRSPALVELRLLLTTILTSRPGAVVTLGSSARPSWVSAEELPADIIFFHWGMRLHRLFNRATCLPTGSRGLHILGLYPYRGCLRNIRYGSEKQTLRVLVCKSTYSHNKWTHN